MPKLMCNKKAYIPKKVCLLKLCGPPNWQTYPLDLNSDTNLIQIIGGSFIFSHSLAKLANMVQDKKEHTPPAVGGLYKVYIYDLMKINI